MSQWAHINPMYALQWRNILWCLLHSNLITKKYAPYKHNIILTNDGFKT